MSVACILASKGHEVVTSFPDYRLAEIVTLLAEKHIGAVVIINAAKEVLGILSERDIVRVLARDGVSVLQDPVSRHMTQKVVTTTENASLEAVMEQMTRGRFRHVPVLKEGRLHGLISIGDVVKVRLSQIETEHRAMRDYIATG